MAELRERLLQILDEQWDYCHRCPWWNPGACNCFAFQMLSQSKEPIECPLLRAILNAVADDIEAQTDKPIKNHSMFWAYDLLVYLRGETERI